MVSTTSAEARPDLRCSSYSRAMAIDPIGTAGSYYGYLLVEWPLPWPRDLAEIPELAPVASAASSAGLRLQGLVASGSAERHVMCYRSEPGPFRTFSRVERIVEAGQVVEAALVLAAGTGTASRDGDVGPSEIRDVLVCTHGRRDRCCGSLGSELAEQLEAGRLPEGVRLWRTSHTGGHRFAPSTIVLPEGTVWGLLDAAGVSGVLRRREPAREVLGGYRGCSGLPARELQALEREAVAELGWEVLDASRSGSLEALDKPSWSRASLEISWENGHRAAFRAEVGIGRRVPIPDCGVPVEQSFKTEEELSLRQVERIA